MLVKKVIFYKSFHLGQHAEKYDHLFPEYESHNDCSIPCVFEHKQRDIDNRNRNKENFSRDGFDNFNNFQANGENRVPPIHAFNPQIKIIPTDNMDTIKKRMDEYSRINSHENLQNPIESFPLTELINEEETGTRFVRKRDGPPKNSKQNDFSEV